MIAPLDEKGLSAVFARLRSIGITDCDDAVPEILRAYLAASPSPSEMDVEDDGAPWVLLKRGLFWRPDAKGYAGLKCDAGRYTDEDAKGYADHGDGTTRMLWKDAPEVAPSCYDDIARAYYQRRLSDAESQVLRLTEENEALRKVVSGCAASLMNGAAISTEASMDFMKLLPTEIQTVVLGLKARIKDLEEAIDEIADFDVDGPLSPETVQLIRIAGAARRSALKENAL